jgi:hypothetical protein
MSAWYQGVAGFMRCARLRDLGNSGGIGEIGGVPVTQAFGMDAYRHQKLSALECRKLDDLWAKRFRGPGLTVL